VSCVVMLCEFKAGNVMCRRDTNETRGVVMFPVFGTCPAFFAPVGFGPHSARSALLLVRSAYTAFILYTTGRGMASMGPIVSMLGGRSPS